MSDIEVGEVFTLSDENNEEQEVEVLGAMDVEGAEYIAVAFVEDIQTETEEDIDIFFLKVEEDSEFSYIENDEEFEKVSAAFENTRTDTYPPSFYFSLTQRFMQQFQYIFHHKRTVLFHMLSKFRNET